jgi:adenylate kinase
VLDKKSLSLRKYLSEHVVPILTEGILKICADIPEDPVDYIAEFLFRESTRVGGKP